MRTYTEEEVKHLCKLNELQGATGVVLRTTAALKVAPRDSVENLVDYIVGYYETLLTAMEDESERMKKVTDELLAKREAQE